MLRRLRPHAPDAALYVAAACAGFLFAWTSAVVRDGFALRPAQVAGEELLIWFPFALVAAAVVGPLMGLVHRTASSAIDSTQPKAALARVAVGVPRFFILFPVVGLPILALALGTLGARWMAPRLSRAYGLPPWRVSNQEVPWLAFPVWFLFAPFIGRSVWLAASQLLERAVSIDPGRSPSTRVIGGWLGPLLASLFLFSGATSEDTGERIDVVAIALLASFLFGELAVLYRVLQEKEAAEHKLEQFVATVPDAARVSRPGHRGPGRKTPSP